MGQKIQGQKNKCNKKKCEGGLNMIDIDSYIASLKVAWVGRIINAKRKWLDIPKYYFKYISINTR